MTYTDAEGNVVKKFNNLDGIESFFKAKYNDNSTEKLTKDNPITSVEVKSIKTQGRYVGTGSIVRVYVTKKTVTGGSQNVTDYTFVKFGDTSGDGQVNATDLMYLGNFLNGNLTPTNAQILAGNVADNRTSRPTYADLLAATVDALNEDDYNALSKVIQAVAVIDPATGTIPYEAED